MAGDELQRIANGAHTLACHYSPASADTGVLFCGGFKSNQQGQKALALNTFCTREQIPFIRFDYSGHGESSGEFAQGNMDTWLNDTLCVIDHFKEPSRLLIVGSSMGAWIAVLAAIARPQRVAALTTIAAAPDFTERLMPQRFTEAQLDELQQHGVVLLPSEYDDGSPYPITRQLLDNSRQHCVLHGAIDIDIPVRMLHGTSDEDVPYELSIELMQTIGSANVELTLVKDGDHRLSEPSQLTLLEQTITTLYKSLNS
ncbi:MAG: alpha/beta hydrolase [Pseudomonadota bacterium]